ncbi:hypothetical protein GH714_038945 [Hevea brasiliensis]|uniref:Uncharacterized protein n=1 Tax=Hevea brasiliensis TaxID=3981 RepID=A0A6A6KM67_HEVBR|nr:hypothetical protein GH714_038945 [Hevea brasiliensis]
MISQWEDKSNGVVCGKEANDISVNVDDKVCDVSRVEGNSPFNGVGHVQVMIVDLAEVNIPITSTKNVDLNIPEANDEANSMRAKVPLRNNSEPAEFPNEQNLAIGDERDQSSYFDDVLADILKQNANNVEPIVENENLNGNVCMDDMAENEGDIENHYEAPESSLRNDIETDARGMSPDFGIAASFEGV